MEEPTQRPDFFISYTHADRTWAEWIAWQLEEAGYKTTLQAWDFQAGRNFVLEMHDAARRAEHTIAVLSPDYFSSHFGAAEWAAAFGRDPEGKERRLIPVKVQPCNVEGLLGPIVYVDLVGLDEQAARARLLARVSQERAKPSTPPAFPVGAFEQPERSISRVEAYRQALQQDPRIARLQILDMNRPLTVADIYIRLRLHQETNPSYVLDAALQEAAELHADPNLLIKASRVRLESRSSAALAPEEAIRTYKRCVVVGDPGAGKTTLLKYLALQSVTQQLQDLPELPIHIELHAFANSEQRDLLAFAATVWEERYGFPRAEALSYMHTHLQTGQALLLLDALDETVAGTTKEQAEASYLHASKAITDLATRYHQASIIVTARKAGYHQRPRLVGFTELEVLDFRPEEITQFVQRWFACHPDPFKQGNAADLNAKLERHPRIQALAANPLLLSLIVIVYEDQLDLPERRAELYKQCVDILLTKWDASRNIRRRRVFKPEQKRQLLEEVAWHFHLLGQRYFADQDVLQVIAAFLPAIGLQAEQNEEILQEIAAENGLLKEQARGWHGFLHLTLQEYLAAQYAVDHQQLKVLLIRRDDPWWEEVLLLYAGRIPDASPLLQGLLGHTRQAKRQDDLFHTGLMLAGRCLAASPTVRQVALREQVIAQLFEVLRTSRYSLTQRQAAKTLAEIGGATVNAQLVGLLANEQVDQYVRYVITYALGQLGERSVAAQLVALLPDEQVYEGVRRDVARALGQLGERSVAAQLVVLLSSEQVDQGVRRDVAGALGRLGERSVIPQLMALLSNRQMDRDVRGAIANALGQLGERSVAAQLVALLSSEQVNQIVRWDVARVLGQLGERSVIPQLVVLLSDEQVDQDVRRDVAGALGQLGERSVAAQLMALLSNRQVNQTVRGAIARALGQLGERSVAAQLVALLSSEQMNQTVCRNIANALGQLGERSVIPQLMALLSNRQVDWDVRGVIANALGQLGERSVIPQLVALLPNEQVYEGVRRDVARALGQLGERSVIPQLVVLLSNEQVYEGVRREVAGALETLVDDEETVRILATALPISDIADEIHWLLWTVSRRMGIRIFMSEGPGGTQVRLVKVPRA